LHGMGATGAVWNGVTQVIEQQSLGRWIAPDLAGHGSSDWQPTYSMEQFAADLISLLQGAGELFVMGHSLGAYVGLALANSQFGLDVAGVLGVGPKVEWSEADLAGARDLAARPIRWFAEESEVVERFRRVSGLDETIAPTAAWLARGVARKDQGFRLAQDPRTFAVAGSHFAPLLEGAETRVLLARGERDAMVSLAQLQRYCPDARDISSAGHNVHVEDPGAVFGLLAELVRSANRD
ncbi:MAG TPA: alpha/beta hydrolase, partial [Steroidobacter sp.]|nr:alpha/beta hydrolase [Steroidobacter sp.]